MLYISEKASLFSCTSDHGFSVCETFHTNVKWFATKKNEHEKALYRKPEKNHFLTSAFLKRQGFFFKKKLKKTPFEEIFFIF